MRAQPQGNATKLAALELKLYCDVCLGCLCPCLELGKPVFLGRVTMVEKKPWDSHTIALTLEGVGSKVSLDFCHITRVLLS